MKCQFINFLRFAEADQSLIEVDAKKSRKRKRALTNPPAIKLARISNDNQCHDAEDETLNLEFAEVALNANEKVSSEMSSISKRQSSENDGSIDQSANGDTSNDIDDRM